MGQIIIYGLGGYDETKPNNNIVEIIDEPDEPIEEEANGTI
jgi:hypothetical protein